MPAAVMIGGIAAAATATSGVVKAVSGAKEAKRSRRAIESYERNPLENTYQNTQVSRLGADLQVEEQARQGASMLEALRKSGTRGIIGGMGRLSTQSTTFNRQIASDLDRQQKELDMLESQDDIRIRAINEERDRQNLEGLGQRLQTGKQQMWQGIDMIPGAASQFSGLVNPAGGAKSQPRNTQSPYGASSGYGNPYLA